jgi:hypothetical protein
VEEERGGGSGSVAPGQRPSFKAALSQRRRRAPEQCCSALLRIAQTEKRILSRRFFLSETMVQNAMKTANIAIVYVSSWEQETKYVVRVYREVLCLGPRCP